MWARVTGRKSSTPSGFRSRRPIGAPARRRDADSQAVDRAESNVSAESIFTEGFAAQSETGSEAGAADMGGGQEAARGSTGGPEVGDGWFADPITPVSIVEKNKVHWENTIRAKGVKPSDRAFAYYREFACRGE